MVLLRATYQGTNHCNYFSKSPFTDGVLDEDGDLALKILHQSEDTQLSVSIRSRSRSRSRSASSCSRSSSSSSSSCAVEKLGCGKKTQLSSEVGCNTNVDVVDCWDAIEADRCGIVFFVVDVVIVFFCFAV